MEKINYQTSYSVTLDTPALIAECVKALGDLKQYPKCGRPRYVLTKQRSSCAAKGWRGCTLVPATPTPKVYGTTVPDVYAYIQNRVHLSRSSIFAILDGSGRLGELLVNPQAFLDTAIAAMTTCLQALMVKGISTKLSTGASMK